MTAFDIVATPPLGRPRFTVPKIVVQTSIALAVPLALLALWHASARLGWLPAQILPDPLAVLDVGIEFAEGGELWSNLRISLYRVFAGFILGGGIGVLLGVAMGLWDWAEDLFEGLFLAISQVPPIGWIPLLVLAVGIGEGLAILVIAKAALIPAVINAHKAIRAVPKNYREVGQVLGFGPWDTLRRIVLPASVPDLFTGIRNALTNAWLSLVAVELLASSEGIGFMTAWGRSLFQLDVVILAMVLVGAIGFGFDLLLRRIEARLERWRIVR